MYKEYAVVFQNTDTKRVKMDIFGGKSEAEARSAFRECYRHGNYEILSTTEIPNKLLNS